MLLIPKRHNEQYSYYFIVLSLKISLNSDCSTTEELILSKNKTFSLKISIKISKTGFREKRDVAQCQAIVYLFSIGAELYTGVAYRHKGLSCTNKGVYQLIY